MAVAMVIAAAGVTVVAISIVSNPTHKTSSLRMGKVALRRKLYRAKETLLLTLTRHMAGTRTISPCGIHPWLNSNSSKGVRPVANLPKAVPELFHMIRRDGDAHAAETSSIDVACITA
jgi:hypothetical protein